MLQIGNYNNLEVVREVEFGIYLNTGDEFGDVLLPKRYVPQGIKVGDYLKVFIYFDSEDRIIATTETPKAVVGEFAVLKIIDAGDYGAFADWGLPKDLLIPFREQKHRLKKNQTALVRVYFDDKSYRIVGSTKYNRFLTNKREDFAKGDEVELLIAEKTDLGYNAIIDYDKVGVIYNNEVFQPLEIGAKITGYIKKVREDGKIDLSVNKLGYAKIDDITYKFIDILEQNGGFLKVNDNSSPDLIYKIFGESKKTFKKTIGNLYKNQKLIFENDGIRLIKSN